MRARSTGSHGSMWKPPRSQNSPLALSERNGTRLSAASDNMETPDMFPAVSTDGALADALERYWGYTSFRPLQREAMDAILSSRDSIVVLPTGGGKSLCFQAPAVVQNGLALIVSPLISLMKDQVDTLVGNGVPAAIYNSSLSAGEKAGVASGLREGRYRLLYISPERLVGEGGESFLSLLSG